MSQATNFRFFFLSTLPPLLSPLKSSPFSFSAFAKPRSIFTVFAACSSSPRRHRDFRHRYPGRNYSSQRERGERDKGMDVEEDGADSSGFNKRRAEGRDKSDKPVKKPQLKTRKLNPANTISYLQILGTGMDTQDTAPSVLLFFDKQRFIFNAGEGLQRFCTEHKIKLSKIDHIFLSRVCSETAGGLPGLLLTLAGIGEEGISVNVWGPSEFKYLVDAMKSFIPNAAMVHTRSFGPAIGSDMAATFQPSMFRDPMVLVDDEVVKISAVFLWPNSFRSSRSLHEETTLKGTYLEGSVDHELETAPGVKSGDMSVIYICELPEIKGKFDPSKAAALGLRPGPKYRELQLGNPVKSDRKNITVYPSDVMDPSVPGPIVLLVDCPTEAHSQELLSMQSLSAYHAEVGKTVTCMIHLSPASVIRQSSYQEWMKRFHSAQHIMAGHERKNVEIPILKSSARTAARLNYLCPRFFPAPGFWCLEDFNHAASNSVASSEVHDLNSNESILAENLLKFTLRPYAHLGLDRSCVPSTVGLSEIIDELHSEIPEIVDAAEHVSQLWNGSAGTEETTSDEMMVEEPWLNENTFPSCLENISRDDLEIVLLGTGSSQPSKYRNVSSIYINLFSKGGLLLDCGEGTLGQLKRRYGVVGADDAVRGLSCIWISHIHADHHTGLARILALRRDLLKESPHEPILVIGPRQLKRYLDAYQRLEDLDMQFLDCRNTTQASLDSFGDVIGKKDQLNNEKTDGGIEKKIDSSLFAGGLPMQSCWRRQSSVADDNSVLPIIEWLKKVLNESGLEALISFPVVHCPQAYGVVLKAAERVNSVGKVIPGWKLVYSGDTRPCPELIEASRGATVLIHEATFEDGLVEEAIARNHSTTKEAIEMGNKAGTFRIILTHFSQRYPKIPVFAEKDMHKTCIGFDMMSINAADLIVLPKVLPFLKLLFKNDLMTEETDDVVVDDNQEEAASFLL